MSEFEKEDMELAAMMGGKFVDATVPAAEKPKKAKKAKKAPTHKEEEVKDAEWYSVESYNWLASCAKWTVVFAGLNLLIFYWQNAGLMAESIAVPCMWVCMALAGFGVGKNIVRECR